MNHDGAFQVSVGSVAIFSSFGISNIYSVVIQLSYFNYQLLMLFCRIVYFPLDNQKHLVLLLSYRLYRLLGESCTVLYAQSLSEALVYYPLLIQLIDTGHRRSHANLSRSEERRVGKEGCT